MTADEALRLLDLLHGSGDKVRAWSTPTATGVPSEMFPGPVPAAEAAAAIDVVESMADVTGGSSYSIRRWEP